MFRWLAGLHQQPNTGSNPILVGVGGFRLADDGSPLLTSQDQRDSAFYLGALSMGYAVITHIERFMLKGVLPQIGDANHPNTPPAHDIRLNVGTFGTFGAQRQQQLHVNNLYHDRGQPRVRERKI